MEIEQCAPTRAALSTFLLRTIYQASIWIVSEIPQQNRLSLASWGWSWDECTTSWIPV